jgi:uncharacterized membrane protein YjfL (UPF0719 family)
MLSIDFSTLQAFALDFTMQFGIVSILLFFAIKTRKIAIDFKRQKSNYQLNKAVTISSAGYYTSVLLVLLSAFSGESFGFLNDLIAISSIGVVSIFMLYINRILINSIYLKDLNKEYELGRENISFALFQSGGFIGTGVILYNSFSGYEFTIGLLVVAIFYFVISQILLFTFVKIATLNTKYDEINEIRRGNIAVGIEFLSLFLAVSLLLGNVVSEVFEISLEATSATLLYFTISILSITYIPYILTGLLIDGNKSVDDYIAEGNLDVAFKSSLVKLILAFLLIETLPLNFVIIHS